MNHGLIPRRYAKALYDFALERGADRRIYELCGTLNNAFVEMPELNRALTNPFISAASKTALLLTAVGKEGAKDTVFTDFLKLLSQNNRLEYIRDIALAYREIYRKANNIHRVTVTSAAKMQPADEQRLKNLIEKHLGGATMEYRADINPDLVGGFTVAVDNERLDASVANALKQLGNTLIKN